MGFLETIFNQDTQGNLDGNGQIPKSKPSRGRANYNMRDRTLFSPTEEPISERDAYLIFDYEPNKGGGDLGSLWKYGFEGYEIAQDAGKKAQRLLPKDSKGQKLSGYEDDQDAFRHALGSYLLTKYYGAAVAKDITDRHERGPSGGLSPSDRTEGLLQDLYNNRVGREAALKKENMNRRPEEVIMDLYRNNKLQTRPFLLKK